MSYKPLKLWFNRDLAELLAMKIASVQPSFNSPDFIQEVDTSITDLELKDRIEIICDGIQKYLLGDYPAKVSVLLQILGPENEDETGMFKKYYWLMPIAKFVEKYGLDYYEHSIQAISEITKRNTGEYAIRPFLERYPDKTIPQLLEWSNNGNKHIRRLASEGGRPRLPWSKKLQQFIDDPEPLLPILENLKDDTSKYVQKSVANCINDILKDNPKIAKSLIGSWIPTATPQRKWIIKHAIRNLRKNNDTWALHVINNLI